MTDCVGRSTCECSKHVQEVTIVLSHTDGPELWPR